MQETQKLQKPELGCYKPYSGLSSSPTFMQQGPEGQCLAGGPVEALAGPESVPPLLHEQLLQVRVQALQPRRGGGQRE